MRDFNFFEPYLKEPEKSDRSHLVPVAVLAFVLSVAMLLTAMNLMEVRALNKEIDSVDRIINDDTYKAKVEKVRERQLELDEIKKEKEFLVQIDTYMNQNDYVNEAFVRFLASELPENLFLSSLSISGSDIRLEGSSFSKMGVAQLEYNLRDTGDFENIFVPEISKVEDFYRFSMNLRAKDVTNYED